MRVLIMLAVMLAMAKPKPPKTDRCLSCDLDQHHPGRQVEGCNCSTCGSGTGKG